VGGCYKVDIVTSSHLETNHHIGKVSWLYLTAFCIVADVIVLTEVAKEVAGSEKDSA
jgi:hypothetical protein